MQKKFREPFCFGVGYVAPGKSTRKVIVQEYPLPDLAVEEY